MIKMSEKRYYLSLDNIIEDFAGFRDKGITYTVSGRRFPGDIDIIDGIKLLYNYIDFTQIGSVYGAADIESPLYGGWLSKTKKNSALSGEQIDLLEKHNLNFMLTLSNHNFSEEDYNSSRKLLERYHRRGNGVICVNDELAGRIKRDYPLYIIEASSIKVLNNYEKIDRALELYDYAVIPSEYNKSDEFLEGVKHKEKIILFANSICDHCCQGHECYREVSKRFQSKEKLHEQVCSKWILYPNVHFDVRKFKKMGFSLFKLVPIYYEHTEKLVENYRNRQKVSSE
jgi:hypothetical protein